MNRYAVLGPAKSVEIAVATKMFLREDKERDERHQSLLLVYFDHKKPTAPREPGRIS